MASDRYRIALYLRLSKEDPDTEEESGSIAGQRLLLENYVRKHFNRYELEEYTDDGYSGTDFLRPGVTALLREVRRGRIDCIAVKDFSRFSRDYIELGSYLERIFPSLGVRFISVNDRYDSEAYAGAATDLEIAFRGLLYDLYSRDLSVKVKSALQARNRQGFYTGANCPFGYERDPKDRRRLSVAADEAAVVKKIFMLAYEGKNSQEIADILNEEGIRTPLEYKMEKKRIRRVPKGDKFSWSRSAVCGILRNRVYIGDIVYGKYENSLAEGKKHLKPKAEWKISCGCHEAVIERSVFEKIQQRRRDPSV